jgi:NAD-dependent deacetylase
LGDHLTIVTQNVDDLLERAGARDVIHMHGELLATWCRSCDARVPWRADLGAEDACPSCGAFALRPDIVWFGEIPYHMDEIEAALRTADLFVAIGTSGEVYPAAGFVEMATYFGADTLEINLEDTAGSRLFADQRLGPASVTVPAWVAEVLQNLGRTV